MTDTKPSVATREDLAEHRGRVAGYQALWGGEEPPISWGTWCAALEVYEQTKKAEHRKQADEEERRKEAIEYLAFAAEADVHSSDVEPYVEPQS